jgi:nucleoside-diphosphate-sugar epimerase
VLNSSDLVLLTGSTGFIGSIVEIFLQRKGVQVRTLSRKPLAKMNGRDCSTGDITNQGFCRDLMRGVKVVIHAAGAKQDPSAFYSVNVLGTFNLLNAAMIAGVDRFVHISSVGVIGADPLRRRSYNEESVCSPRNDYEKSKNEAEKLVKQAGKDGLSVAIIRPANVFGDRDPQGGLLGLIRSIRDGRFAFVGGSEAVCNYVFVEDVAHACIAVADHPAAAGKTFHLADDCTIGEFVDVAREELGVKKKTIAFPPILSKLVKQIISIPSATGLRISSPVMARLIALNNQACFKTTRMEEETGFRYPVGWRNGLRRVIRWYRAEGLV